MADVETETLWMTRAEFARHRGVSKTAVTNWIDDGKIAVIDDKIDAVAADRALGEVRERIGEPRDQGDNASAGLTRARTAEAVYRARNAQLDYEEKIGNVVSAAGVADAASVCAEAAVRIVKGLSQRSEAFMAAAKDVTAMRTFIKGVERDMLTAMALAFEKMAAEASSPQHLALGQADDEIEGEELSSDAN